MRHEAPLDQPKRWLPSSTLRLYACRTRSAPAIFTFAAWILFLLCLLLFASPASGDFLSTSELGAAFRRLDADQSGCVTLEEFTALQSLHFREDHFPLTGVPTDPRDIPTRGPQAERQSPLSPDELYREPTAGEDADSSPRAFPRTPNDSTLRHPVWGSGTDDGQSHTHFIPGYQTEQAQRGFEPGESIPLFLTKSNVTNPVSEPSSFLKVSNSAAGRSLDESSRALEPRKWRSVTSPWGESSYGATEATLEHPIVAALWVGRRALTQSSTGSEAGGSYAAVVDDPDNGVEQLEVAVVNTSVGLIILRTDVILRRALEPITRELRVVGECGGGKEGGATSARCVIDGNNTHSIFSSTKAGPLSLVGLWLRNAASPEFYAGAAVFYIGTQLSLTNCTLSGNAAAFGGAVFIEPTPSGNKGETLAIVLDSVIAHDNEAALDYGGGAVYLGLYRKANCTLTITRSEFTHNSAFNGGALRLASFAEESTSMHVVIEDTAFAGNTAEGDGGGLDVSRNSSGAVAVNITRCTFRSHRTGGDGKGGAVRIASAKPLLQVVESRFVDNWAGTSGAGMGGAVYVFCVTCRLAIHASHFSGNIANFGGAVGIDGDADVRCVDSNFTSNLAIQYGGAFMYYAVSTTHREDALTKDVRLEQCRFTANLVTHQSDGYGGAIYLWVTMGYLTDAVTRVTRVTLSSCEIFNSSAIYGGGIWAGAYAVPGNSFEVTLQASSLRDNHAALDGGGMLLYGQDGSLRLLLEGTAVARNRAERDGGVGGGMYAYAYVLGNVQVLVAAGEVSHNRASAAGAAYLRGAATEMIDSHLSGNMVEVHGGAIRGLEETSLSIQHCVVSHNRAGGSGGAVCLEAGSRLDVASSSVTANDVGGQGGALQVTGTAARLVNTSVLENSATSSGGAISAAKASTIELTEGTEVRSNVAGDTGGGLSVLSSRVSIAAGSRLAECVSVFSSGGGMLLFGSAATLADVELAGNTAKTYGGGVVLISSEISVSKSRLLGNTAEGDGGHLYITASSSAKVESSAMVGGVSSTTGGAVFVGYESNVSLVQATIAGGSAVRGGAIGVSGRSDVTLAFADLRNNSAELGGALFLDQGADVAMLHSTLGSNWALSYGGGMWAGEDAATTLENVTLTGNAVTEGSGGGLALASRGDSAKAGYGGGLFWEGLENASAARLEGLRFEGCEAISGPNIYWEHTASLGTDRATFPTCSHCYATAAQPQELFATSAVSFAVVQGLESSLQASEEILISSGELIEPALQFVAYDAYGRITYPKDAVVGVYVDAVGEGLALKGVRGGYSKDTQGAPFPDLVATGAPGRSFGVKFHSELAAWDDVNLALRVAECQPGEEHNADADTCTACPADKIKFTNSTAACEDCPSGMDCLGGSRFVVEPGYWMSPGETITAACDLEDLPCIFSKVYACKTASACTSGGKSRGNVNGTVEVSTGDLCSTEYHSGRALCGACAADHQVGWFGNCSECPTTGWLPWAQLAAIVVGLIVVIEVLVRVSYHWSTTDITPQSNMKRISTLASILLSHLQITAQMSQVYARSDIPSSYEPFVDRLSVLNLSMIDYVPLGCLHGADGLHFYAQFVLFATLPVLLSAFLGLYVIQRHWKHMQAKLAQVMQRQQRGSVRGSFFFRMPTMLRRAVTLSRASSHLSRASSHLSDCPDDSGLAPNLRLSLSEFSQSPIEGNDWGGDEDGAIGGGGACKSEDAEACQPASDASTNGGSEVEVPSTRWLQAQPTATPAPRSKAPAPDALSNGPSAKHPAAGLSSRQPEDRVEMLAVFCASALVFLHPVCATRVFAVFKCEQVYLDDNQYWLEDDYEASARHPRPALRTHSLFKTHLGSVLEQAPAPRDDDMVAAVSLAELRQADDMTTRSQQSRWLNSGKLGHVGGHRFAVRVFKIDETFGARYDWSPLQSAK
eukprot:gene1045-1576_t